MSLLLTSHGWENNAKIEQRFLHLIGKPPIKIKIFLVTTARKKDKDWKWVRLHINLIKKLGIPEKNISVFSLDRKVKKNELGEIDAMYVCGGNTFLYLSGIKKTGLNKAIKQFLKNGGLYYGISAGSVVAGPDISFVSLLDDVNTIRLKNTKGLGLTEFAIAPHYNNKKYKTAINQSLSKFKYPIIPLTDKQAIEISTKGNMEKFRKIR